ncbi:hypothetical protein JHK86_043518 [Glycine max]|nr:hypothetical protein JHK86_043518 [Glycine max]
MCAPTVRKLCTLSNLFHSKLLTRNCNNTNVAPFTKPFPESEDEIHLSSEPDLARDSIDKNEDTNELSDILCYDAKSSDMSIEKKIEFPESSTGKVDNWEIRGGFAPPPWGIYLSHVMYALFIEFMTFSWLPCFFLAKSDEVPPSTFSMMNIDEDRLSFHTSTDGYGYLLATLCSFIAYLFILYTV